MCVLHAYVIFKVVAFLLLSAYFDEGVNEMITQ